MVDRKVIDAQLQRIGVTIKQWGAAEVRELANIMVPGEQIVSHINGWYENGFATMVATDHRLLLIDKKPLYLAVEDIRYDLIAEVDYSAGVLSAQLCMSTVNKQLRFKSMRHKQLRDLAALVQVQVMRSRQQQQQQSMPIAQQFTQPVADDQGHPSIEWLPHTVAATGNPQTASGPFIPATYPRPSFTMTTKHQFLPKVRRNRY